MARETRRTGYVMVSFFLAFILGQEGWGEFVGTLALSLVVFALVEVTVMRGWWPKQ